MYVSVAWHGEDGMPIDNQISHCQVLYAMKLRSTPRDVRKVGKLQGHLVSVCVCVCVGVKHSSVSASCENCCSGCVDFFSMERSK